MAHDNMKTENYNLYNPVLKYIGFTGKIVLFVLVAIGQFSCKKSDTAPSGPSKNEIILSVNNGEAMHYNEPAFTPGTEKNDKSFVAFDRTTFYYTGAHGVSLSYNNVNITLFDQNVFNLRTPYQVKEKAVNISISIPDSLGAFTYSSVSAGKGNMAITVNYASGQRLVGTFKGVIYSNNNQSPLPVSVPVSGSFDVLLPAYLSGQ